MDLPFRPPGDLPDPRIELESPVSPALAGGFFTTEPPGKPSPSVSQYEIFHSVTIIKSIQTQTSRQCLDFFPDVFIKILLFKKELFIEFHKSAKESKTSFIHINLYIQSRFDLA